MSNFTKIVKRDDGSSIKWDLMMDGLNGDVDDAYPMSIADLDFPLPKELVDGMKGYMDTAILGYSDAMDSYYDAVISWFKRRHDWDVLREEIILSPGVIHALYNFIKAFTEVGDGVLILEPVYNPFALAINNLDRRVVGSDLVFDGGVFLIDFEDLESKLKDSSTKLMIMCSPHNPVGRVWTKEELEKVADLCWVHDVLVVSDEIHFDIVRPEFVHTVFANVSDKARNNCIICTSTSKTFNLAGTKNSNIVIHNEEIRDSYKAYLAKNGVTCCDTTMMAQKATELAYNECEYWADGLNELIDKNYKFIKEFIADNLEGIKISDLQGTYLLWINFGILGLSQEDLIETLEKENLFLNDGAMFCKKAKGCMRMNIAFPTPLVESAFLRIKKIYDKELNNH